MAIRPADDKDIESAWSMLDEGLLATGLEWAACRLFPRLLKRLENERAELATLRQRFDEMRKLLALSMHDADCTSAFLTHLETGAPWSCTCECGAEERDLRQRLKEAEEALRNSNRCARCAGEGSAWCWCQGSGLNEDARAYFAKHGKDGG